MLSVWKRLVCETIYKSEALQFVVSHSIVHVVPIVQGSLYLIVSISKPCPYSYNSEQVIMQTC
eukprot:m.13531 g.13531  ORF g.13531 m.13531 type:complete len:63 (-) comp4874_c0_seq1:2187-2375(-)